MITTITIEAGYQRGRFFYQVETPFYLCNTINFDRVVAQVRSGRDEFGEPVEIDPRAEVVRVSEVERNGSHGETVRQVDVPVR